MTKSVLKKSRKMIISSIMLCLLLIGASYAFFSSDNKALTEEGLAFGSGLNISYLLEAKADLTFNINPLLLPEGGQSYIESTPSNALVMLGNNSEYDNVKCSYEIWYTPKDVYTNSANAGANQEMVIVGTDSSSQNTGFIFDLNGVNQETKLADGVIYVRSKTADITQNWSFTLRHYNLDVKQEENIGKTFGGTINFKPLGCKNE